MLNTRGGLVDSAYFARALVWSTADLVSRFKDATLGTEFDTIIGTGLSGTIFAARVAEEMGVRFAILRKPDDESTHSESRLEGCLGNRWVFVDDFAESWNTVKRVLTYMSEERPSRTFVGVYMYEGDDFIEARRLARQRPQLRELILGPQLGPVTTEQASQVSPPQKELLQPYGGFEPHLRPLVKLPADLEVSFEGFDGNPTFWSRSRRCAYCLFDYPQLAPIITAINRATECQPVQLQGRRVADVPELGVCVTMLDSK